VEDRTICPWCQTEIVWDEEIGPESHCPHCDNELSGYRTVKIGIDPTNDRSEQDDEDEDEESWQDEEQGDEGADLATYINRSREHLALEETVERLLDQQEEVPECPSCREYMLAAGKETVGSSPAFTSTIVPGLDVELLPAPFEIIRYVCPACFTMQSKLAKAEQDRLVHLLAQAADHNTNG